MLPDSAKNKIEQIWLDVIGGGVAQPTEVIEQLTYLMFAKQLDEMEADIETSELLSGKQQKHIFGSSNEEFILSMLEDSNHHMVYENKNSLISKLMKYVLNVDVSEPETILQAVFK